MWAILALALAAGVGACSTGGEIRRPQLSLPVRPRHRLRQAPLRPARSRGPARPQANCQAYQPSKVVSETSGGTELSTADSVSKVTRFYENALKDGGWRVVSTAKTAAKTTIVAMRGRNGVGILISSAVPAGTSISVVLCAC